MALIDMLSAFWSSIKKDIARTVTVTASRSLSNTDNGKILVVKPAAAAATIVLTIPSGLTAGFACTIKQGARGLVKIIAGSGVTMPADAKKRSLLRKDAKLFVIAKGTNSYGLELKETSRFGRKCTAPTASVAAGTYAVAQSVTLATTTPSGVIFYTVDGSTPSPNATKYTAAVAIAASATLKAATFAPGMLASDVLSNAYVITP